MFTSLFQLFHTYPALSGGIMIAASAWGLSFARGHLSNLWRYFLTLFSVQVTIWSDDSGVFTPIESWLSDRPGTQRVRILSLIRMWSGTENGKFFRLVPGSGTHVFREGWQVYFVNRSVADEKAAAGNGNNGNTRKQTLTITTLGRSRIFIESLVRHIEERERSEPGVQLWMWQNSSYRSSGRKALRALDTVYMDSNAKNRLIKTLEDFYADRKTYEERGIPWRLGIMLYGPTGTGKTSLIFALASHFKMAVHIIQPSSINSDDSFLLALNDAGSSFVVIEDIDSLKVSETRAGMRAEKKPPAEVPSQPGNVSLMEGFGITQSGLLNGIDGLGSREGRVLFITTNTPEVLDPALIRPGRIDYTIEMTKADRTVAKQMWGRFFGEEDSLDFFADVVFPVSQAELQGRMIDWSRHKDSV